MRKFTPIKIKVYLPSGEGVMALNKATAEVHAAAVVASISALDCSADTKVKLLDSTLKIKK